MEYLKQVRNTGTRRKYRWIFFAPIFLLLGAIVAIVIQKQHESAATIGIITGDETQFHIQRAEYLMTTSLVCVGLAILFWGIAILCCVKYRWVSVFVVILLLLYAGLTLLIV